MSQFISDFFSWTTAAVAGCAVLLGGVDLTPAEPAGDSPPEDILVASVETAPVINDATPPVIAPQTARTRQPLPQIRAAELREVDFTATMPRTGVARPPLGRVTGASVNLRAGPGTSFAVVSQASLDEQLVVTGERNGVWIQVLTRFDEQEAWIHGRYFDAPDGAAMRQNN